MIDSDEGRVLEGMTSAQITRNLNNSALIERARKLPYCKRNIMLTKIIFWDRVFSEVISSLISHIKNPKREWDVNARCLSYIVSNNLANPFFAEFFFNFHQPLTDAFLRKLKKELGNGMAYDEKFNYLAVELYELLNIALIELEGMEISCESFGGGPICPAYGACGRADCENSPNIFFLMMNEEYRIEENLFEKILDVAFSYLKRAKNKIIIVVDYKNINQQNYVFGAKARQRYDKSLEVVEAVYFYNWNRGLTFQNEFTGLEKFKIPDKKGLKRLVDSWSTQQKLVYYDNPK